MASATAMIDTPAPAHHVHIPRWLHWWAILTVLAAFPLLLLGAEVTTHKVGMVDQVGLRSPWHLFEVAGEKLEEGNWGFLIEHSHRTFGWLVGACSIVLAGGLLLGQRNTVFRWLGVVSLAGVCIQGLLGRYRVDLNAQGLAFIHGCFAQLVFATLVSTAYLTGVRDYATGPKDPSAVSRLQRMAVLTAGLVYIQIVFGVIVRHTEFAWGPRIHLVLAFVVLTLVITLWTTYRPLQSQLPAMGRPLTFLVFLVGIQLLLGVEAWISKFATPQWNQLSPLISNRTFSDLPRSLHSLVGAFLFAGSVVTALAGKMATTPAMVRQPVSRLDLEVAR